MAILNYTTKIDSSKTLGEIQSILASKGAKRIMIDYDDSGNADSLSFAVQVNEDFICFKLPCNWQGVLASMKADRKVPGHLCNKEQALRVGWRIVKNWVEAQMAIIEAKLVTIEEVFFPYALTKNGTSVYEYFLNSENKKLLQSSN